MTAPTDEPIDESAAYIAAYTGTLDIHLQELREHACAIGAARYAGVDDTACVAAYHAYVDDLPEPMIVDLLWWALWVGVRSADREAAKRLIHLNNAATVAALEGTS